MAQVRVSGAVCLQVGLCQNDQIEPGSIAHLPGGWGVVRDISDSC